jgi:hypothetical protein
MQGTRPNPAGYMGTTDARHTPKPCRWCGPGRCTAIAHILHDVWLSNADTPTFAASMNSIDATETTKLCRWAGRNRCRAYSQTLQGDLGSTHAWPMPAERTPQTKPCHMSEWAQSTAIQCMATGYESSSGKHPYLTIAGLNWIDARQPLEPSR